MKPELSLLPPKPQDFHPAAKTHSAMLSGPPETPRAEMSGRTSNNLEGKRPETPKEEFPFERTDTMMGFDSRHCHPPGEGLLVSLQVGRGDSPAEEAADGGLKRGTET